MLISQGRRAIEDIVAWRGSVGRPSVIEQAEVGLSDPWTIWVQLYFIGDPTPTEFLIDLEVRIGEMDFEAQRAAILALLMPPPGVRGLVPPLPVTARERAPAALPAPTDNLLRPHRETNGHRGNQGLDPRPISGVN